MTPKALAIVVERMAPPFTEMGKTEGGAYFGWGWSEVDEEFSLGYGDFEMFII